MFEKFEQKPPENKKENKLLFFKERKGHFYSPEEIDRKIESNRLGIERDSEGKIILYHTTLKKYFAQIEKNLAIKPSIETGNRAWRVKGEESIEKLSKIYLATKEEAKNIAKRIQNEHGGSTYILEVHLAEDELLPDEDTGRDTWDESLEALKTCSYKGEINEYKVVEKTDFLLPLEKRKNYGFRTVNEKTKEGKEKIMQEYREETVREALKEEEEMKNILTQDN